VPKPKEKSPTDEPLKPSEEEAMLRQNATPPTWYDTTKEYRTTIGLATIGAAACTTVVTGTTTFLMGHWSGGTISTFGIYPPEALLFTLGFGAVATLYAVHNTQTSLTYDDKVHSDAIAPLNPVAFGLGTVSSIALCVVAVKPLMVGLTVSRVHTVAASIFFYSAIARAICLTVIQGQDEELLSNLPYAIACDVAALSAIIYMPFAIAGSTGGAAGSTAALAAQVVAGGGILLHTVTV
jgi:hypothetical protein